MKVKFVLGGELPVGFKHDSIAEMQCAPNKNDVLKIAGVTFHIMAVHHILHKYIGQEEYSDHEVIVYANLA